GPEIAVEDVVGIAGKEVRQLRGRRLDRVVVDDGRHDLLRLLVVLLLAVDLFGSLLVVFVVLVGPPLRELRRRKASLVFRGGRVAENDEGAEGEDGQADGAESES